jgi:CHAD domain-containing protein
MSKPLKVRKVSPSDLIQETVGKILRTRLKEFYSHWPKPQARPTPEQLHSLRISGKRLRYSAEQLREFYPGRLALLIDLLKHGQDLLGEIQDCVTQRAVVEGELLKLKRHKPGSEEIIVMETLIAEYDERQDLLFEQFREIWVGLVMTEFRAGLKVMVSTISPRDFCGEEQKTFQSNPLSE